MLSAVLGLVLAQPALAANPEISLERSVGWAEPLRPADVPQVHVDAAYRLERSLRAERISTVVLIGGVAVAATGLTVAAAGVGPGDATSLLPGLMVAGGGLAVATVSGAVVAIAMGTTNRQLRSVGAEVPLVPAVLVAVGAASAVAGVALFRSGFPQGAVLVPVGLVLVPLGAALHPKRASRSFTATTRIEL